MSQVRPKKHLGQHFLTQVGIAERIAKGLQNTDLPAVEIGPGMGVLTQFLLDREAFFAVDVDDESVAYLKQNWPEHQDKFLLNDFLKTELQFLPDGSFTVIGNFPYNISSQIFFRILEYRNRVEEVVCMIQKEVADRIACPPGSKTYGILSVLLQAFYDIKYLFTVHENAFNPPPKVKSGVIRLVRNERKELDCDEVLFIKVVKTGFNQRRKTLRNSLKTIFGPDIDKLDPEIIKQRPEQLSVDDFVTLTRLIQTITNQ